MSKMCYSCGAPLESPEFKGPADDYCKYCTDESGNLKPRDTVKTGIAMWLKGWQPDISDEIAQQRAEHYMQAMPAWAD
jgi:hypothetical protein